MPTRTFNRSIGYGFWPGILAVALLSFLGPPLIPDGQAASRRPAGAIRLEGVTMRARPRTPDQMSAFYEARRFPAVALREIRKACFVTISILNESPKVVWLEPARWRFVTARGAPVQRLDRDHWDRVWRQAKVPNANRATFQWTQLPERRDLRPAEPVGGNLSFRPPQGPFTIIARFQRGPQRRGPPLEIIFRNIRCPGQPAAAP